MYFLTTILTQILGGGMCVGVYVCPCMCTHHR